MIAYIIGKYDTIVIDCVAMNVNDLICVGAKPLSLVGALHRVRDTGWTIARINLEFARHRP